MPRGLGIQHLLAQFGQTVGKALLLQAEGGQFPTGLFAAGGQLAQSFLADGQLTADLLGVAVEVAAVAVQIAQRGAHVHLAAARRRNALGQLLQLRLIRRDGLRQRGGRVAVALQLLQRGVPVIAVPFAQQAAEVGGDLFALAGAFGLSPQRAQAGT